MTLAGWIAAGRNHHRTGRCRRRTGRVHGVVLKLMNVDAALRRDDEIEQQIRAGLTGERGSDGVGGQRGSAGRWRLDQRAAGRRHCRRGRRHVVVVTAAACRQRQRTSRSPKQSPRRVHRESSSCARRRIPTAQRTRTANRLSAFHNNCAPTELCNLLSSNCSCSMLAGGVEAPLTRRARLDR